MPRKRNQLIKVANEQIQITDQDFREFTKCSEDPIYFIDKYCKLEHPTDGIIPFRVRDYQKRMLTAFHNNRFVIVLSARQTGKPLWIEEDIPTPTGFCKMKDLHVGDYVLSANGTPTKIVAVSSIQHNKKCFKIYFSTGETITCDAEHLWEVQDNNTTLGEKTKILSTQEMVDEGYLMLNSRGYTEGRFSIKLAKPLNLPEQQLIIDPYVFGAWLSDETSVAPEITNHQNNHKIIEQIEECGDIDSTRTQKCSIETKTHYFKGLHTDLKTLNVLNDKHIPTQYLRASYQQRLSLLQGLMDTNGYINPKTGLCEITLTNKRLIEDVHELLSTLGLKSIITESHIGETTPCVRWTITFTVYESQREVFKLQRKLGGMNDASLPSREFSTRKRTIIKIEEVESVPVRCITVDNSEHLYLVGRSMIPTHNSWSAGAFLMWYAIFQSNKTVLIASNKDKNAREMMRRIKFMYEHLPMWLKPGVTEDGWNKHSLIFDNDSRILSEATTDNTARGMSSSLLFLDEFAFVRDSIQEEFWSSVKPTLSTGGQCIICSTPNGDTNIFAQLWRGANSGRRDLGEDGFVPVRVYWNEPPNRDEKFKRAEIAAIGEHKWRQEYECEFLSNDTTLIDGISLAQLKEEVKNIKPIGVLGEIVFYKQPQTGKTYLVGVDPSTGNGEDFTSFEVFEFPSMEQIAEFRSNTSSSITNYSILKRLLRVFEKVQATVYFTIENNGVGEAMISLYEADESPPEFAEFISERGTNKRGMTTTQRTKLKGCMTMKEMIERRLLKIRSIYLLEELQQFVRRAGSYAAKKQASDDSIMALLLIFRILEEISSFDQDAYDTLYMQNVDDEYDETDIPLAIVV